MYWNIKKDNFETKKEKARKKENKKNKQMIDSYFLSLVEGLLLGFFITPCLSRLLPLNF
jgi:F0F1-type ATP synthase assembly protein I